MSGATAALRGDDRGEDVLPRSLDCVLPSSIVWKASGGVTRLDLRLAASWCAAGSLKEALRPIEPAVAPLPESGELPSL